MSYMYINMCKYTDLQHLRPLFHATTQPFASKWTSGTSHKTTHIQEQGTNNRMLYVSNESH